MQGLEEIVRGPRREEEMTTSSHEKGNNRKIGNTIGYLHIRIEEQLNTRAISFQRYLIKRKNNDNIFSIKTEAIALNVGNVRNKDALLIAK